MLVQTKELARAIGKNHKRGHYWWQPDELQKTSTALDEIIRASDDAEVELRGVMPFYYHAALSNVVIRAGKLPKLEDSKIPPVPIPTLKATHDQDERCGVSFNCVETNNFTVVNFTMQGPFFHADRLPGLTPPVVPADKGVIVAGAAPHWLAAAIVNAYKDQPWVALRRQPGTAVVCINNDEAALELGYEIPSEVIESASPMRAPLRGEVWLFENGHGVHPGVIVSLDHRNRVAGSVILVPMTSRVDRYLPSLNYLRLPAGTAGLDRDSLARCGDVLTLDKTRLRQGPLGILDQRTLDTIVTLMRRAVGDAVTFPTLDESGALLPVEPPAA